MNIQRIIGSITDVRDEEQNLLKFIRSLHLSHGQTILDVGCGFGAKLKLLRTNGFNVIGVDANQEIIAANRKAGMACMTVNDFNQTTDLHDVLLMSHVIEHFPPQALLNFMDSYLDRLKPGGYLIIATPLSSPYFYDDFDHVKPYHPGSIDMAFGNRGAQVRFYSRNKLELMDIWFRKGPFQNVFIPRLYFKKYSPLPILANLLLAFLFKFSFGMIGRTDGWMGLYKKISGQRVSEERLKPRN